MISHSWPAQPWTCTRLLSPLILLINAHVTEVLGIFSCKAASNICSMQVIPSDLDSPKMREQTKLWEDLKFQKANRIPLLVSYIINVSFGSSCYVRLGGFDGPDHQRRSLSSAEIFVISSFLLLPSSFRREASDCVPAWVTWLIWILF